MGELGCKINNSVIFKTNPKSKFMCICFIEQIRHPNSLNHLIFLQRAIDAISESQSFTIRLFFVNKTVEYAKICLKKLSKCDKNTHI